VSEPVRVYELETPRQARTRIDVVLARSAGRFVGRRAELAELEQMLDDALAGHGQVVGIVGEPGVGKTRLCIELVRQCATRGAVLGQAHCPAYAAAVPLLPIRELLRSLLGVRADDSADASRKQVRRALLQLHRGFADALPLVFDVLEIGDPARTPPAEAPRRGELAAFLRRLVQTQSAAAPLVLFVDDLHCINPAADALLGEMVDALGWTRTLLLVNFRPQHRSAWMGASYYRELSLSGLADDDLDELLRRLMGDEDATAALRQLICERTGGNPFFAEEVVQSLIDHGLLARESTAAAGDAAARLRLTGPIADLAIPATVQALLGARLDRLPEHDKQVLEAAAVVGRRFAPAILRHVFAQAPRAGAERPAEIDIDAALTRLQRADFIRRDGDASDAEFAFRHPLTQAVAYASQLVDTRARLHVAVARALQASHPEQLGQLAELLAHHFSAAEWKFEARRWRRRAALRVTNIALPRPRK
jgi:predicted ATPase